jgi:hypothetical protein
MFNDPIIEEIRQAREAHAAKFNYNLVAIYQDIKEQERKSGKTLVSYPAKLIQPENQV